MNRYLRPAAVLSVLVLSLGVATAAHAQTPIPVANVNFQPATSAVPAGYVADTGAAYDATRGYGWIRQDSVGSATPVPLDLTRNTRDRARTGVDPRLNTVIHMQYGDTPLPLRSNRARSRCSRYQDSRYGGPVPGCRGAGWHGPVRPCPAHVARGGRPTGALRRVRRATIRHAADPARPRAPHAAHAARAGAAAPATPLPAGTPATPPGSSDSTRG